MINGSRNLSVRSLHVVILSYGGVYVNPERRAQRTLRQLFVTTQIKRIRSVFTISIILSPVNSPGTLHRSVLCTVGRSPAMARYVAYVMSRPIDDEIIQLTVPPRSTLSLGSSGTFFTTVIML